MIGQLMITYILPTTWVNRHVTEQEVMEEELKQKNIVDLIRF